jgi:tRNA pseudouridine65 synthase
MPLSPGARPTTLSVLHADRWLLALDKPSGLLMHQEFGGRREPVVLVDLLRQALGVDVVYPLHRLDRGTSGVVLFALDLATARDGGSLFENHAVSKTYVALVRGRAPDLGIVAHPLTRREGGPRVPAETAFGRLATVESEPRHVSLMEAHPRHGRQHQIRRHFRHLSHPLIGDNHHGRADLNREFRARYGLERLALHAAALSLVHPRTGERLHLVAPLPDDLLQPLSRLGFDADLLHALACPRGATPDRQQALAIPGPLA